MGAAKLLTVEDVMERLGVDRRSARALVLRLPYVRLGTGPRPALRLDQRHLDAFIQRTANAEKHGLREDRRAEDETPEEYELRLAEDVCASPDKYYQRGEVVRLEADEREAELDAWQLTRSMREAELAERFIRNADGCERYGRMCSYFDVCCGTASLDDPSRFELVDNVHPELSAEAAE